MSGGISRRWNWFESGLMPLVSASMRAAWLAPLLERILSSEFVSPVGWRFGPWLVVALLLGGSVLGGLLQEQPGERLHLALAGLVATLLTLAFVARLWSPVSPYNVEQLWADLTHWSEGLPASLVVVVSAALLWRCGVTSDWLNYQALWSGFFSGVLVLGGLMVFGLTRAADGSSLWGSVFVFLVCGLLALALLSAINSSFYERGQALPHASLNRQWMIVIGVVTLGVLLLGWGLGRALSPGAMAEVIGWFRPIWNLLMQVLVSVAGALAYVILYILEPLINAIQAGGSQQEPLKVLRESLERQFEDAPNGAREPSRALEAVLHTLFFVGLALLLALILSKLTQRRGRRPAGTPLESRNSVFSAELLRQQISELFNQRPRKREAFLPLAGRDDPRYLVRMLYRRFLDAAREAGHPRLRRQTPLAYERALADVLPVERSALRALTEAYLVARYAPNAPSPESVESARRAVERLEAALLDLPHGVD